MKAWNLGKNRGFQVALAIIVSAASTTVLWLQHRPNGAIAEPRVTITAIRTEPLDLEAASERDRSHSPLLVPTQDAPLSPLPPVERATGGETVANFSASASPSDSIDKSKSGNAPGPAPASDLKEKFLSLCWVAFAPTNFNPDRGMFPPEESILLDLQVLRKAGFDGLVTYGAKPIVYGLAQEVGFKAMILGVWDPTNPEEMRIAKEAGRYNVIVGYVVGNEGLDQRYDYTTLKAAMEELRRATGKPVTTTEEWENYLDPRVMELGDWVFPNVHPYWHGVTAPEQAAEWTAQRFGELRERTDKVVVFKEVGLPTGGDPDVDETKQMTYYRILSRTSVPFVYFEAYDQPWKQWASVEPHWGLFRQDRSPKRAASYACSAKNN